MMPLIAVVFVLIALACGKEEPKSESERDSEGGSPPPTNEVEASALPADDDAESGTGLSPTFVPRDINHIISTGQSLSVGLRGDGALSITQPYANIMFARGVAPQDAMLTSFAPLVEGFTDGGGIGPDVETMSAGLVNLVAKMAREDLKTNHDMLVTIHGVNGFTYADLKKGTSAYARGMVQAKAAFDLAKTMNKSYVVRAVTNVHGESDHLENNTSYAANLAEWQADIENDVKAINGQSDPIPMFHTQVSSWTKYGPATSVIPVAQLQAHITSNGKIVLVGPKYHLEYSFDGLHLTAKGYRHMGEDYAKAYRRVILEGKRWEPVRPLTVTRTGSVITVRFAVPSPPLVLDPILVKDPGKSGFEYVDAQSSASIQSVAVTAPDRVTITLSAEPTGTDKRLRYAFTGVVGTFAGPETGARGNLRDSDATVSRNGDRLHNWCVHFDEAVP